MRFTIGQMCNHWSTSPASVSAIPAATRPFSLSNVERVVINHCPAHSPSIIVASVGMKLNVDQPPPLNRNGAWRGNRFRNQTSNAQERFEFLLKCARKPSYRCGQPAGTPTFV